MSKDADKPVSEVTHKKRGRKKLIRPVQQKEEVIEKAEVPKNSLSQISLSLEVAPNNHFILCDGKQIKDYRELVTVLETMSDDIYGYHVNSERNDFATWIADVFKEEELANQIRNSRSKTDTILLLYKHLLLRVEKLLNEKLLNNAEGK